MDVNVRVSKMFILRYANISCRLLYEVVTRKLLKYLGCTFTYNVWRVELIVRKYFDHD